jgi:hypothetical protein
LAAARGTGARGRRATEPAALETSSHLPCRSRRNRPASARREAVAARAGRRAPLFARSGTQRYTPSFRRLEVKRHELHDDDRAKAGTLASDRQDSWRTAPWVCTRRRRAILSAWNCLRRPVKRSEDGGDTFEDVPLPEPDVFSVAFSAADGAVYAGTEPSRLFCSRDGGESWAELVAQQDIPRGRSGASRLGRGLRTCAGSRRARTSPRWCWWASSSAG